MEIKMKLRSLIKPKGKKGAIGIIIFFMALMLVLVLGFICSNGLGSIRYSK